MLRWEAMMRRGACVIRYEGARGVVWKVKYCDADGVQVKETLGRESDGWTERKARAELEARLVDVKRDGLRRVAPVTLAQFAPAWLDDYAALKTLKRSTVGGYRSLLRKHLIPSLGHLKLDAIDVGHIETFVASLGRKGYEPATINRVLNLLNEVLHAAQRRKLVRTNPIPLVDRPREPRRRWAILTPAEIARVAAAFGELVDAQDDPQERRWLEQARVVFVTVMGTGMRRGEILGLRWRNVFLADPDGAQIRVAETWVRDAVDTPKSEAGERTIAVGGRVASELFEHRGRTEYAGEDHFVFCHPAKGSVLDSKRYAETYRAALKRAKIERKVRPFHDGRHTHITNAAASGMSPAALQAQAGHSDYGTTQRYIDLAGVTFREEAAQAEDRMFGRA
jgi:integrase